MLLLRLLLLLPPAHLPHTAHQADNQKRHSTNTADPSPLPLIHTLTPDTPTHTHTHTRATKRRLNLDDAQPVRITLDLASLDAATAPQYTACFAVGAWFRRGLPVEQSPPADGVATCDRSVAGSAAARKAAASRLLLRQRQPLLMR